MRDFMRRIYFKAIAIILAIVIIQCTFIVYLPCKNSNIAYAEELLHKGDLMDKSSLLINNKDNLSTYEDSVILKEDNTNNQIKESESINDNENKDGANNLENNNVDNNNDLNKPPKVDDNESNENIENNEQGSNTDNDKPNEGDNSDGKPEIDDKKKSIIPSISSFAEDIGKNYERLTVSSVNNNAEGEYTFFILASDKLNVCKKTEKDSTLNKWFIPLIEINKGEQNLAYSVDGKTYHEISLGLDNKIPYYMRANVTGAPNFTEKERDSSLYFKYVGDSDDSAIKIRIHYIPSLNANDNNSGDISDNILKSVSIYGTERVGSTLRAKVKYKDNTDKPKVLYQWLRCKDKNGEYKEISDADKDEYKLKSNDKGYYLKVKVTVSGELNESKESDRTEIIKEKLKENSSNNSGSSTSNKYDSGIVVDTDKTNDDQMYLNTSYSSKVDKEIFDLTKEYEYEKLILEGSNYVWNFNASDLKNVSKMDDSFDSDIQINNKNNSEVVINFKHHGDLPGKATVQVNVGNELNGDNRYLYYYNEETNSLELISSNISVKKGKATFSITHCSKYILSTTPSNGSNIVSNDYNEGNEITIGGNFVNNTINSDGGDSSNGINFNNANSSQLKWKESIDGKWYLSGDSFVVTGWKKVDNDLYYFNDFGIMQKGWVNSNGKWYYLDNNGVMATGWIESNSEWYYLNSNGEMSTGWKEINKVWYHFNASGAMETGWQYVDYRWYYLYPDGAMAYDVEIDGRMLNQNGAAR